MKNGSRLIELPSFWTRWRELPLRPSAEVLRIILDDGQAFRWHPQSDGSWLGLFGRTVVQLRLGATGALEWRTPQALGETAEKSLRTYLALDDNFESEVDALPWRSDPHLARCISAFPGLRILRQPFGETLLCFLCSSSKQIVQIKRMVELLARSFGEPLAAVAKPHDEDPCLNALPTWTALHKGAEKDLRACGLGFRAAYVKGCAEFIAAHPGWLEETAALPYPQAHERLCTLPGVGAKIADCVLLYSGTRLEAFPVDTWILKTMARRYGLERWSPEQVALFGRLHFGKAAGLAQQFLFNFERNSPESEPRHQQP